MGISDSTTIFALAAIGFLAFLLWWIMAKRQQNELRRQLSEMRREAKAADKDKAGDAEENTKTTETPLPKSERSLLFLSYSHRDEKLVEELRVHLSPVLRSHRMDLWSDSSITSGREWLSEVKDAIGRASVAIAVVSPDYLASDWIQDEELQGLIRAHEATDLRLFWLPARPSAVEATDLANYQALLNPGQPLSTLGSEDREIALVTVAETIARYLEKGTEGDTGGMATRGPNATTSSIRLREVRLQNIRCFRKLSLNLDAKPPTGDNRLPSLRTIFVGNNATGKSTLLRSIALGLCDESRATALLTAMKGRMIRYGAESGTIELHFCSDDSTDSSVVVTEIGASPSGAEIVRKSGDMPPHIVVAGYGSQRTRFGTDSNEQYDVGTAVGTLFDDDAKLQNPELAFLRQPRWIRKGIQQVVAGVLGLQAGDVEYRSDAIRVHGSWGQERIEFLSDGYRSTTQWMLDFMGWLAHSGETTWSSDEVTAIILIDELEQHLHPQWQRMILSRLRTYLPRVQFLITTHSPLIAASVTGLEEDGWREKLFYFGVDEEGDVRAADSVLLRGMSVQQILASPAFDYLIEADPSVAKVYAEASRLASKGDNRSKEEDERYKRVKQIVGEMLTIQDETLVEQEARRDLHRKTQKKIAELESAVFGEKS